MSRTSSVGDRGRRSPVVALGLAAILAVAACGGGSSSSPTDGPDRTEGPDQSQDAEPTTNPGESTAPGDGTAAFEAATTALDALDSYSYRVEIQSVDTASGTSFTRLSGTVVNQPEEARLLTMADLDENGDVTSSTSFLIIGEEAWTREGEDDAAWTSIPSAQAQMFIGSFAAFRPEQMFGVYFAGFGGNFTEVGSETVNGVETTHYEGDEELGTILGGIAGVQGQWSSDAWIAKDGGYLVRSEASAEAEASGSGGSFSIVVDITDIDSAGPLDPPD
ncbi:MAG TPA: LppX_LprAFG lipoprotein [Candidatus Limnocylindrales bacterium]|nr:LppX_LprAFG lipoprotein [Candidatus Limnocylindrales bacterium]